MNKNCNLYINTNIIIKNKFKLLEKITNIIGNLLIGALILNSLIGNVVVVANRFYIENNIFIKQLFIYITGFSIVIYLFSWGIRYILFKVSNISISDLALAWIMILSFFNYLAYYEVYNYKNIHYIYIYIIILILSIILKNIFRIMAEYKFINDVIKLGIEKYGDNYKEYREVILNFNEELTEEDILKINLNYINFGEINPIIEFINECREKRKLTTT